MTSVYITKQDLNDLLAAINGRFDAVDQRFDALDERFDALDERFDKHEKQNNLEFMKIHGEIFELSMQQRQTNDRIEDIDGRLKAVENDVKEIYNMLPTLTGKL